MLNARSRTLIAALAVGAAALAVSAPAAFASSASARCARWARSQLDPYDLTVMQSSISASARLAVAIRLRSLEAQCRGSARRRPRHSG